MKYQKYSMPKHERDRLAIEKHRLLVEKAIMLSHADFKGKEPRSLPLGNGCYWVRAVRYN